MKVAVRTPQYERRKTLEVARMRLRNLTLHRDWREPRDSNTKHSMQVYVQAAVVIKEMRFLDYGFWEQIPVPVIKDGRKDVTPIDRNEWAAKGPHHTGDPDFDARINFVHHQTHEQREDLYKSDAWRQYKEKMKWANFATHYGKSAEDMANAGDANYGAAKQQWEALARKLDDMMKKMRDAPWKVYPDDWDTDHSDEPDYDPDPDNWHQFRRRPPSSDV